MADEQARLGERRALRTSGVEDAFDEALRRDPDLRRRWVVLVDDQRDQIKRVERAARKVGVEITIVLDIVHALEYL